MTESKKTGLIVGIIITAIAIPVGIYTISPLLVSTVVNEPVPNKSSSASATDQFEEFMAMTEEQRLEKGQQMTPEERYDNESCGRDQRQYCQ